MTSTIGCRPNYDETTDFAWFQQHFDNETFVLISWEGCTLDDPRLELFAKKIVPPETPRSRARRRAAEKAGSPQVVRRPVLCQVDFKRPTTWPRRCAGRCFKSVQTGPRLMSTG